MENNYSQDYEVRAYLLKHKWIDNRDGTWISPLIKLNDAIPHVATFNRDVIPNLPQVYEIQDQLRAAHWGDGNEGKKYLNKYLADCYDLARWTVEVKDREPYVRFTLPTEDALRVGGFTEAAEESFRLWREIEIASEKMGDNHEDSLTQFETACRNIWTIWNDEVMRTAQNWTNHHFIEIFDDDTVRSMCENPIVWTRIDLRGTNTKQKERFQDVIELDSMFPERHILRSEHLTDYTQKHRKAIQDLVRDVKLGKTTAEEADTKFGEILKDDEEPEQKPVFHPVCVDRRYIYLLSSSDWDTYKKMDDADKPNLLTGKRAFIVPDGIEDRIFYKLLSRLDPDSVGFVLYATDGYMLASKVEGYADEKITYSAGLENPEIREYLEDRGITVKL